MKTTLILLLPTLLICPAAQPAAATSNDISGPDQARFIGKLITTNGLPVEGATVEIYQYPALRAFTADINLKARALTDSNGVFQASLPRAEALAITRKAGLAPSWLEMGPGAEQRQLLLMPPTNLVGVVVDETGRTVDGAEVWAWAALFEVPHATGVSWFWLPEPLARQLFSSRSGANGRFRIENVPTKGGLFLTAHAPGRVYRETRGNMGLDSDTAAHPGKEVKLVIEPTGSLEGKVLTATGQPAPGAHLDLEHDSGMAPRPEAAEVKPDGTFRFRDVAPGNYRVRASFATNTPSDWVADRVPATVEAGQVTQDVRVTATRGGFLELSFLDAMGRPLPGVTVSAWKDGLSGSAVSGAAGKVLLRLTAGQHHLGVSKEGLRGLNKSATVEDGVTNRLEMQFEPPPKIYGTLRDPAGQPMVGVQLFVFPNWRAASDVRTKTDKDGRFELLWDRRTAGPRDDRFCLVAVVKEKNLSWAEPIDEDTRQLDLQLQPSLTLTGCVEDPKGQPISNAEVNVNFWLGNMGTRFGEQPRTDAFGRFRVSNLPVRQRYFVNASADGFGSTHQDIQDDGQTNLVELSRFVLQVADQIISGQVLDDKEQAVPEARVSLYGTGQPDVSMTTDQTGHFQAKVCAGEVNLGARLGETFAHAKAQSGETNLVLQLQARSMGQRPQPKRASLKGRPLPDLSPFGLSAPVAEARGPLLICLFDSEQRPSRRLLRNLLERSEAIHKKNVTVVGLEAVHPATDSSEKWKSDNQISFPVGWLSAKTAETKWVSDVESLPWLMLVDSRRVIIDEGFALDELEARLDALR